DRNAACSGVRFFSDAHRSGQDIENAVVSADVSDGGVHREAPARLHVAARGGGGVGPQEQHALFVSLERSQDAAELEVGFGSFGAILTFDRSAGLKPYEEALGRRGCLGSALERVEDGQCQRRRTDRLEETASTEAVHHWPPGIF